MVESTRRTTLGRSSEENPPYIGNNFLYKNYIAIILKKELTTDKNGCTIVTINKLVGGVKNEKIFKISKRLLISKSQS